MTDLLRSKTAFAAAALLIFVACGRLGAAEIATEKPAATPPADKTTVNAAKPVAEEAWTEERLNRLVKELSDDRFSVRERAAQELADAPPKLVAAMVKTARDSEDPEVQKGLFDASRKIFMAKLLKHLAEWKIGRGFLGISWGMSEDPPGIQVSQVIAGTGAEKAGVKAGDLIVKIDKQEIGDGFTSEDAVKIWKAMAPGDPMKLELKRDGEAVHLDVTIGEVPEDFRDSNADQTESEERAEALWKKYLAGEVKVPERLLLPTAESSTPSPNSKPVSTPEAGKTSDAAPSSSPMPEPKP
ncbi:MAG: PDZ domain-containing protein [Planctomycetes bacterium]|nr:PDZ domain-containing protein [Planctomycetota bacterium]